MIYQANLEKIQDKIALREAVLKERKECLAIAQEGNDQTVAGLIRNRDGDTNFNRMTGRTLEMVLHLPDDEVDFIVVVHKLDFARSYLTNMIRDIRGNDILRYCNFLTNIDNLRGRSKYRTFVDHAVWEFCSSDDFDKLRKFLTY